MVFDLVSTPFDQPWLEQSFLFVIRSKLHPMGLPGLEDSLAVTLGNRISENMAAMIKHLLKHDCMISIENPRSSLLWHVPCVRELPQDWLGGWGSFLFILSNR